MQHLKWAIAIPCVAAICAISLAPTDHIMGHLQRILYVHVSVAWLALIGLLVTAITGSQYLRTRELKWDAWSLAANQLGWLCCSLTLITGSCWARAAWGTWWTWDPRLTSSFILWLIYSGCLLVRGTIPDISRRARVAAILAILGTIDVPLVIMATRWFRGIHPVSPDMDPSMRMVLLITVLCFSIGFVLLLVSRQRMLLADQAQHASWKASGS